MTVRYEDLRSLVQSGGMFTAADLLEKLSDVLTVSQKQQLVSVLAVSTKGGLRPGDLITAELANQILGDLLDLQTRVLKLEAQGTTVAGKVRIDRVTPSGITLTVGDTLVIEGVNFEYAIGAAAVFFGGKKVPQILGGSSDNVLLVSVQDPGSLAETGTEIDLVVSNRTSTDSTKVKVKPKPIPLSGNVEVTPGAVTPDPLLTSTAAKFSYTLISAASRDATFALVVNLAADGQPFDPPQHNSLISVLDKNNALLPNNSIKLIPGIPESIFVGVTSLPFANQSKFNIQVLANAEGANGFSPVKTYIVGAGSNDDDFLSLSLKGLDVPSKLVDGEIRLGATDSVFATLTLTLTQKAIQAGVTSAAFDITRTVAQGSDGWSGFLSSASGNVTATAAANFNIEITTNADPSLTGRIDVTVTRKNQGGAVAKIKQYGLLLRRG